MFLPFKGGVESPPDCISRNECKACIKECTGRSGTKFHSILSPPQSWTASFNPFRASLGTQQTTCSIREHLPTREAKDSEHPDPTEGGKDSVCTVKQGTYIYPRKHKIPPSGRQAKVVYKTMGTTGHSPISSRHPQTGLSPTIQGPSQAVQNTLHSQRIQQNRQRQCLVNFYTRPPGQKRHRGSKQTRQSRILQSTVLSSQTREQMETCDRPQLPKPISNGLKIQDGNPRINPHIAQTREWVTSIDLSDAYLYIPIHPQSRKFLRFHHKETSYQFTSLPFGLATAPLVFTSLVKEVKLLALKQDIRLHQYLDDWLIRASSQDEAQKHTVKLLSLIQDLGFIVNLRKSELNPQQRFDFIDYHFLLDQGLVRPTNDRGNKIQISFNRISKKSVLSARTLMPTIGWQFTVHNPCELYVLVSSALPTTRRDMTCTVLKAT